MEGHSPARAGDLRNLSFLRKLSFLHNLSPHAACRTEIMQIAERARHCPTGAVGHRWSTPPFSAAQAGAESVRRDAAQAATSVTAESSASTTPGCHHAKPVAVPSAVVASGTKPEIVAAIA